MNNIHVFIFRNGEKVLLLYQYDGHCWCSIYMFFSPYLSSFYEILCASNAICQLTLTILEDVGYFSNVQEICWNASYLVEKSQQRASLENMPKWTSSNDKLKDTIMPASLKQSKCIYYMPKSEVGCESYEARKLLEPDLRGLVRPTRPYAQVLAQIEAQGHNEAPHTF